MTPRQQVIDALNHRQIFPIPYHVDFTGQEYQRMVEYTGKPNVMDTYAPCKYLISYSGRTREIPGRPGFFEDDYGVIWNRTGADRDIGVIERPVIEDIECHHYRFPQVDEAKLRTEMEQLVARKKDRFAMAGIGFSMFERAWTLCSMEEVLMAMVAAPAALDRLLEDICDYHLQMVRIMLEYDVDGIYFGDDWGQQKGLIMGKPHWVRFIKPRIQRLYDEVKAKGKFVVQHSCGDINEILPELVEMGLDCYQTFQPEIYDIQQVKSTLGQRLSFWGGISTQRLLPFAEPDVVQKETARILNILGKNGGYIAAPTHAVPGDVPPENIMAMLEVFAHQEQFGING